MTVADRIDKLEVGVGSVAFWGLGQVGIAIKGPTSVLHVDPYLTSSDGTGDASPGLPSPARAPRGY